MGPPVRGAELLRVRCNNQKVLSWIPPTAPIDGHPIAGSTDDGQTDDAQPRLQHLASPVRDGDDSVLTFRGEAEAVHLLTWMPMFPTPPPFIQVAPGIWQTRLRLPRTARIEYRLAVTSNGRTVQIDDPLNPPLASNPFGTNSVLVGPDYRLPWYVREPPEPARGQLHEVRVTSAALGHRRHHHVYLPEGFKARRGHPLLLVHDGSDFLQFADLAGCLDRLIESGTVDNMAAVLLDPWNRVAEYGANESHSRHLVFEVLPHVVRRLRLRPTGVGAIGSSLGAVAALAASWHYPKSFSGLALLSGSFAHTLGEDRAPEVFASIVDFMARFEADPRLENTAVYQSVGRYERLCDLNRRLAPMIRSAAARHLYQETWDGHHWGSWRDRLGAALAFLFPQSTRSDGFG